MTISCWPVFAEYSSYHMDIIAIAESLEQVKEWMPQIITEGWEEEGDLIGYYTCEHDIGSFDQNDYSICRFDPQGNIQPEYCFERTDK